MKKTNTNSFNSKPNKQKQAVFSQKKVPSNKIVPVQKVQLQNSINQSVLNDTLEQFVNTTDMNLENIQLSKQDLSQKNEDKTDIQIETVINFNNASTTLDINEDSKNNKHIKFDDSELAQNSIDYKNLITSSTPSIINEQLYFKHNKSESTLSNITFNHVKPGQKKQNEQDLDEDYNLGQILPQQNANKSEQVKPKKAPSKKNSVAKVKQFSMDEEDEYEYEEEDDEQEESEYDYEEDEEEEEEKNDCQNNKQNGKITIEQLVTLDPLKSNGMMIQQKKTENEGEQTQKFQHQKNTSTLPHSLMENRLLMLELSHQDSNKFNKNSPNFGNQRQRVSFQKNIDSQKEKCNQEILNQNPEANTYYKSSYTTQYERNSLNVNASLQSDIPNLNQKKKSRQIHPLQLSISSTQNYVQQYGVSPNNLRHLQSITNQEMQMNNANLHKQGIIKTFGSRANSISRGPTPSRVLFPNNQQKDINSQVNKEQNPRDQFQQDIEPTHCKICLETECTSETGKMITPCKCSGTLRNVHEECLKTWILTQQKEIMEAQCEVCMKPYDQTITFGLKLNVKNTCRDGKMNCLTSSVISMFVIALIIVISLLFQQNDRINHSNSQYASSDSFLDSTTHVISLIIICFIILLILLIIIYYTLKEACCILVVKEWIIEQYVSSPQIEQSQIVEGTYNYQQTTEYQNQIQYNLQNNKIITYQQFLMERRSMPTIMPQNIDEENRNIFKQNNRNFNQSRNSPKSQAQSCVTQMQNKQQKKLSKQEQQNRINQLLKSKKQLNKPILFNQRIYSSSRRQSQSNAAVRVSYDLS
ncbi:zinc finger protein (macronuclear) [Tetrahymena thermophila SB210]|uniref:Zinc finger protein n=1 Tax=Tetrahymena thermophila (strain SB210) TaxID=312017 RepID=Q232I9_TETTS|nr:zinc finger protein [Tetrahymena thermophila SB210]EAR91423.1 zinc finger protein [Tetrahymena thermophila SB210]|eukprot:XP_001011668.1 zinc finger protein [Tetrahymena thermophila SB210]